MSGFCKINLSRNILENQAWFKRNSCVASSFYEREDVCCERENEKASEMSSGALFQIRYYFLDFLVPSQSPRRPGTFFSTFFSRPRGQPDFLDLNARRQNARTFEPYRVVPIPAGRFESTYRFRGIFDFQERSSKLWWPNQADTNLYSFEVGIKNIIINIRSTSAQCVI